MGVKRKSFIVTVRTYNNHTSINKCHNPFQPQETTRETEEARMSKVEVLEQQGCEHVIYVNSTIEMR